MCIFIYEQGYIEKEMQEGKMVEESLPIAEKRREAKRQRRKGKIYPTEYRFPKIKEI